MRSYDDQTRGTRVLARVSLGLIALAALVLILRPLLSLGRGSGPERQVVDGAAGGTRILLPSPPSCADVPKGSDSILIETNDGSHVGLTNECYAAMANTPLKVTFVNSIATEKGDVGIESNLSIYATQADAVSVGDDGGMLVDPSKALFVGKLVVSIDTVVYNIPPLPVGTYYIQSDLQPERMFATFVVG